MTNTNYRNLIVLRMIIRRISAYAEYANLAAMKADCDKAELIVAVIIEEAQAEIGARK